MQATVTRAARGRSLPWAPLLLLLYAGIAVALCSPAWRDPGHVVVGGGGDAEQIMWYLRWIPHAITHGQNPFVTHVVNHPNGVNLAWAAGLSFLPSLVLWPVTEAWGSLVAYDLYLTAGMALSAWVAALVLRRWTSGWLGPAAGGLFYGFSPYMAAHALGHPHLVLVVAPPLLLACLDELVVRQRRGPVRLGLLIGLIGGFQMLVAQEVLASTLLVAVAGVAVLAALHRDRLLLVARARRIATAFAVAAPVTLALAAVPLAVQFLGPLRVSGRINSPVSYSADLLSAVVPTKLAAIAPGPAVSVSNGFTGNIAEWNGYLGIPLVLLLVAWAWRRRADATVRNVGLIALATWLLSLGPFLHVAGHNLNVPLPEAPVAVLPVLTNLLPGRLALFVDLLAALLLARLVDDASGGRGIRLARLGALALALVVASPAAPLTSTRIDQPSFFSTPADLARLAGRGAVLVSPYPRPLHPEAMVWQASADFAFSMPGGYVLVPGRDGKPTASGSPTGVGAALERLEDGGTLPPPAALRFDLLADMRLLGIGAVVVGPGPGHDHVVDYLAEILGGPADERDGVSVWWSVPPPPAR
jgi:hypothetical protein